MTERDPQITPVMEPRPDDSEQIPDSFAADLMVGASRLPIKLFTSTINAISSFSICNRQGETVYEPNETPDSNNFSRKTEIVVGSVTTAVLLTSAYALSRLGFSYDPVKELFLDPLDAITKHDRTGIWGQ